MVHSFALRVLRKISQLDEKIRIGVDRILPKNLTVRYLAALIAVATIAISGQVIIQTSLSRQTQDQKRIQLLVRQLHDSENLKKAVQSLQLSSRESQIKIQIDLIESLATQFKKNAEILKLSGVSSEDESDVSPEIAAIFKKVEESLTNVIENCQILSSGTVAVSDRELNAVTQDLLSYENIYRTNLAEISKYYDQRLEDQITHFKRTELFLLFATLVILMIEALYVFRPAVESLYDALRIRSEFLGRMGHEMRNPMNSILGMAHLLSETPLTDQQMKYLSILKKSSSGLLEVLNNLLDFSSIESGTMKVEATSFDLYKLVEKAMDLSVYGAHANGIELVLDLGMDVPLQLTGDPVRLQQILSNLLGNAVKFTEKGEVTLQIQLQRKAEEVWIQFAVIDTGIGIEKSKIDKIFAPFVQEDSTVRRRFGGTGLGLSISKDLVSFLGGTLAVESQKNLGSKFFFTIPFSMNEDFSVRRMIEQLDLRPFHAWIAEPNDSITKRIVSLISECGGRSFRTYSVQDLKKTFIRMTERPTENEVLLVDYEYAREALPTLLSQLRKFPVKTDRFIFLIKTTTSSADIETLTEYGIKNFIFKPVKPVQFLEAIQQALSGWTQISAPQVEESNVVDSRPIRILAADDSKDNQLLIAAYLSSLPYRITFADHGLAAVEKFKSAQFDIVLMDLQMPEMDGYSATEAIRQFEKDEKIPAIPIIAISAHDYQSHATRIKEAQFSDYLVKPISPTQLRQAIWEHTREGKQVNLEVETPAQDIVSSPENDPVILDIEKHLADLVPHYLENRRQELIQLNEHLENQNFEKIQTLGHRTRGNAKSYGFDDLGKLGARLEEAAIQKDTFEITCILEEMAVYLKQFDQSGKSTLNTEIEPPTQLQQSSMN